MTLMGLKVQDLFNLTSSSYMALMEVSREEEGDDADIRFLARADEIEPASPSGCYPGNDDRWCFRLNQVRTHAGASMSRTRRWRGAKYART